MGFCGVCCVVSFVVTCVDRYLLAWHQYGYKEDEKEEEEEDESDEDDDDDEDEMPDVDDIVSNSQLSEAFHNLARDLDVLDPKDPESDIFKEQLLENSMCLFVVFCVFWDVWAVYLSVFRVV